MPAIFAQSGFDGGTWLMLILPTVVVVVAGVVFIMWGLKSESDLTQPWEDEDDLFFGELDIEDFPEFHEHRWRLGALRRRVRRSLLGWRRRGRGRGRS